MKAVVILLSIVLFIACLVLGIQAGNASISIPDINNSSQSVQATAPSVIQRTVVLVNVDDLSSATPQLTAVWLVMYRSDMAKLSLYPLYPSTWAPDGVDLAGSFAFQADGSLGQAFLDQLNAYHFSWDGYLVVDRGGTAAFVDWIGGTELGNGDALADLMIQNPGSAPTALDTQTQVGQAICNRLSQVPASIDWSSLWTSLISGHIRSTMSFERLNDDWQRLTAIDGSVTCEFPHP